MDEIEFEARLRLYRSKGIGPQKFWALMRRFGAARRIEEAHLPHGFGPQREIAEEINAARALGAAFLLPEDPRLGGRLAGLPDTPPLLWAKGNLALLERPAVALIGARNASSLGLRMAESLARALTERGYVVISGLARGIDAAAHRGALEGGTIAVLGTGLAQSYPAENRSLQDEIGQKGLLLSEYAPHDLPLAHHFPARNRIVAGLAQAVIVVEAAQGSGSLLTARDALDLGREVMAVPGHPFDPRAAGCNALLRDGAGLVRSVEDVLAALRPFDLAVNLPPRRPQNAAESLPEEAPSKAIVDLLGVAPTPLEDLRQALNLSPAPFAALILEAEVLGQIQLLPGGMIARNPVI